METPQQQRRPTIGQFATKLKQSGLDLGAVDLADIFWLAQFIEPGVALRPKADSKQTKKDKNTTTSNKTDTSIIEEQELTLGLFADQPDSSESSSQPLSEQQEEQEERPAEKTKAMPFPAPAAPALRTRLDLGRSLKPLMGKIPSKSRFDLDEEKTVTQIAETRVRMAIERPRPERWLELELVVEGSKTTVLWERAIAEMQHLTEYHGAFRTVGTWRLEALNGKVKLFPRWNTQSQNKQHQKSQRPRNPKELLDPRGRRLVLFITDCTSALWREGMIHQTLWQWSEVQPVAIVQMLPERLWGRTALSDGHRVRLSSLAAGMPNARLEVHGLPLLDYGDEWELYDEEEEALKSTDRRLLTLPIVTLDFNSLHRWAKVVAGIGDLPIPGRTFELAFIQELAAETPLLRLPASRTARQRVALFQATASQTAQKLAGLMAATPVSLPVIDLLRDEFLPEAQQAHVAEVLLSGLLQRNDTDDEEKCHYEFFGDGSSEPRERVRYLLLDSLPEEKAVSVLNRLSQIIAKKVGYSLKSFEAFLAAFQESEPDFGEAALPFARVGLDTLRRLGGDWGALARRYGKARITKDFSLEDIEYEVAQFRDFPPLEDFEYEAAKITNILERFEFETAQVEEQKSTGFLGFIPGLSQNKREIRRYRSTNWSYSEVLSEEIGLEMVSIPGGTFIMGAPKDEPQSPHTERPQHQVTLADFYLGRYPVTQAQWRVVASWSQIERKLDPDPSRFKGDNRPVERVSWEEAVEFCQRLSAKTGRSYRLPSEAQWEYACRSVISEELSVEEWNKKYNQPFHYGEMITTDLANYNGNYTYNNSPKGKSRGETTEVGSFPANRWGLSDMHGNVWEWCSDDWHHDYEGAPEDGKAWLEEGKTNARKVVRGGSWYYGPAYCRSASRGNYSRGFVNYDIGFRVVWEVPRTLSS